MIVFTIDDQNNCRMILLDRWYDINLINIFLKNIIYQPKNQALCKISVSCVHVNLFAFGFQARLITTKSLEMRGLSICDADSFVPDSQPVAIEIPMTALKS